jgi:glycerophosphoryl diester phosphodiesterase
MSISKQRYEKEFLEISEIVKKFLLIKHNDLETYLTGSVDISYGERNNNKNKKEIYVQSLENSLVWKCPRMGDLKLSEIVEKTDDLEKKISKVMIPACIKCVKFRKSHVEYGYYRTVIIISEAFVIKD